ncbi:unnamed protein product [Mytilus coruscus]|uniref:Uncharacterized protein n=1 Tax=Mytilus coruscus TaxID=42192 RepID=A0A6J8D5X1_MYTCO|nr:unnamed protein product [Mytilus coruscus]
MQAEGYLDNSLSKRNGLSMESIHNETIGSFHEDALSNIKADPLLGVGIPGSCVLYNGALVITDGGGDETSDDGSVIDMPEEELKKWKTARETIQNKIRQTESNIHLDDMLTPYTTKVSLQNEKSEIGTNPEILNQLHLKTINMSKSQILNSVQASPCISATRSCESFNQAHEHLQTPSQSLLAPSSLQRRGMLGPLSTIQETINKKDHNSKSVKKKSNKKKKKNTDVIKKETMQWPESKQAEIETHCDSSTDSFSMPSFELAEDLPLKSTENLSGPDTNVSVDCIDHMSSNYVESFKQVKFKADDEYFVMDSYESSNEESVENNINCKD